MGANTSKSILPVSEKEEKERTLDDIWFKPKEKNVDIRRIADKSPLVQVFGSREVGGPSFMIYARNRAGKEITCFTTSPVTCEFPNPSIRYTYSPRNGNAPVSLYTLMVCQCRQRMERMMTKEELEAMLEMPIGNEVKIGF